MAESLKLTGFGSLSLKLAAKGEDAAIMTQELSTSHLGTLSGGFLLLILLYFSSKGFPSGCLLRCWQLSASILVTVQVLHVTFDTVLQRLGILLAA